MVDTPFASAVRVGGWYRLRSVDHSTEASGTRAATAIALALLVAVLVVAARSEEPVTSPRTGRSVELVELIRAEQQRNAGLEADVADLSAEVEAYEAASAADAQVVSRLQRRVDRVLAPSGMTAVRGPGLAVTLSDSSLETPPSGNVNDLVIHEQDLQAVINALWAGGTEAMTVNDQRILATTAIRCVGNTLLLHGNVYSPPYEITAVGEPAALQSALDRDPVVARFRRAAQEFDLGFAVAAAPQLHLPASDAPPGMVVAEVTGRLEP